MDAALRYVTLAVVGVMTACTIGAPQSSAPGLETATSPGPAPGDRPARIAYATTPPPVEHYRTNAPPAALEPPPPPPAEDLLSPELSASPAAAKLVDVVTDVKDNLVVTRYKHKTRVLRRKGYYAWDCSGMVAWMLKRSAPRALRSMKKRRPRAIDFYDAITRAPVSKARRGWQQLAHVSDARPGDLFAFPRSPISTSPVTGHVGLFIEQPWPVPGVERAWAARILDATRTPHQDDTRTTGDGGGFGFGTMMFVNDATGKTIAYGWHGTNSRGYMPTHVAYGRVAR